MVANISENTVDEIDPRTRMGRYVQARTHEERGERDRFKRDRLAAGVRSGEEQDRKIATQLQIVGDAVVGGDQRVA